MAPEHSIGRATQGLQAKYRSSHGRTPDPTSTVGSHRLGALSRRGGARPTFWAVQFSGPAFAAQTVQVTTARLVDDDTLWAEDARGTKLRIRLC